MAEQYKLTWNDGELTGTHEQVFGKFRALRNNRIPVKECVRVSDGRLCHIPTGIPFPKVLHATPGHPTTVMSAPKATFLEYIAADTTLTVREQATLSNYIELDGVHRSRDEILTDMGTALAQVDALSNELKALQAACKHPLTKPKPGLHPQWQAEAICDVCLLCDKEVNHRAATELPDSA
jgi:hypothetical protein